MADESFSARDSAANEFTWEVPRLVPDVGAGLGVAGILLIAAAGILPGRATR